MAWPGVHQREMDLHDVAGGGSFIEIAASPSGRWSLGEEQSRTGDFLGPAELERKTGNVVLIRKFSSPTMQIVSMGSDDEWVAWVEASLQPSFVDWTLYSYSLTTQTIRRLATAPKPDGVHYPVTALTMISLSHGVIAWSAVEKFDGVYHVYVINADGTGRKTIAADARGPELVWPRLVYDVKPQGAGMNADLVMLNLVTGQQTHLAGPEDVSYFAFDGNSVAWISSDGNDLRYMSSLQASPETIFSGRFLQFVTMNNRLIGWGQDLGAFAYDRKLKKVVQLSNLYDAYPVISDQALDWTFTRDSSNPILGEIDVSELP